MMAHFFRLNEGNNFYLRHFSLKPIFTPLGGESLPQNWANRRKNDKVSPVHKNDPQIMNLKHKAIHISSSVPNLSQLSGPNLSQS